MATDEPQLSYAWSTGSVVLSWPSAATNWVVERAASLRTPSPWVRVSPDLYRGDETTRSVEVPAVESTRFFRLRNPGPAVPGLTGLWELNEGSGPVAEEAGGSGSLLELARVEWSGGRSGRTALRFNGLSAATGGSRAWVDNAGYRVLPAAGRPFSVALWLLREESTPGWSGLAGHDGTQSGGWQLTLHTSATGTNEIVFAATGVTEGFTVTGRVLMIPGRWHELVATYDGSKADLYLDGVWLAQATGNLVTHDGPIHFGGGIGGVNSFLGRIDEIRTFDRALSAEDLSLAGAWRFDESGGRFGADSSIHGRHATLTSAAGWTSGRQGGGVVLAAAAISVPNIDQGLVPPTGGPFSLSFWLTPRSLAASRGGLMSCVSGTNSGWSLMLTTEPSGGSLLQWDSVSWGGSLDLRIPVSLTNEAWTKFDLTYNGGVASAYVNGMKVGSDSGAIRGARSPLTIGSVPGIPAFDGVVDDLKVYRRERDETEIGPVARPCSQMVMVGSATNLVLAGSGPVGRPLTFAVVPGSGPTNGTIVAMTDSPVVTYQAGGLKGPDRFAYTVSDGEFTSPPAIVSISVVQPHWLSPEGGALEPRDGSHPDRAWAAGTADALDAIWRTNRYYDCFFYAPGDYETRGWKYMERSTLHPGCKHIGSGSDGPARTTLRLVEVWSAWAEGYIFATLESFTYCDDFEVHNLMLDCNAPNVPKFAKGEPVWIRVPLEKPSPVESLRLSWGNPTAPRNGGLRIGRATEFSVIARFAGNEVRRLNLLSTAGLDGVEEVSVGVLADELVVQMERRAEGVDYYGLVEVAVSGASMSLPSATAFGGGSSQLGGEYPIVSAVDGDESTAWASGPEEVAEIALPLDAGSLVDRIDLRWNCKGISDVGRLGPAVRYRVLARDEATGEYLEVPFVSQGHTAQGNETVTFGTLSAPQAVPTDRLLLVLQERELGVNFYSLREVTPRRGSAAIPLRLPVAFNSYGSGIHWGVAGAFDGNPTTQWASGTQGSVGAIYSIGNNLKFTRLKIVGFGTKAGRECFPMFLLPAHWSYANQVGNILVEDCLFTDPAPRSTDGLSVLSLLSNPPSIVTNAIVRRCTVSGVRSQFTYSHAFAASHVEDCFVQECGAAVYFEPAPDNIDDVGPVLVRSNRFHSVDFGVFLYSHPESRFDSVTCIGNDISLNGVGGYGFLNCDTCNIGPPALITNVTFMNNVVRFPDWSPRPGHFDGGMLYGNIRYWVAGNNILALGTSSALRVLQYPAGLIRAPKPVEDCDSPGPFPPGPTTIPPGVDTLQPGFRRAWFNNRNLSGDLLDVRFLNDGVDGLASEQQWGD